MKAKGLLFLLWLCIVTLPVTIYYSVTMGFTSDTIIWSGLTWIMAYKLFSMWHHDYYFMDMA